MSITLISLASTKHINDFLSQQLEQISKFKENFIEFRTHLLKIVFEASKTSFTEAGFNHEDYGRELVILNLNNPNKRPASSLSAFSQLEVNFHTLINLG